MNKIITISLFFLLSTIGSSSILATVISLTLWSNGNKRVGTIGDHHKEGPEDICHKNLFYPFLDQLAGSNQKTEIVLEHIPEQYVQREPPEEDICLTSFSRYAYKHGLKNGNLSFLLSDLKRKLPAINSFNKVFDFIIFLLFEKLGDKRYTADDLKSLASNTTTTKEMLDTVNSVLDILKELKQSVSPSGKTFLDTVQKTLVKYYNDLKLLFQQNNQQVTLSVPGYQVTLKPGSVAAAFVEAIRKGTLKPDLHYINDTYMEPTRTIREVGMIKDTIESQDRIDKTLVYGGADHIKVINKLLLALGYTPIGRPLGAGFGLVGETEQPIATQDLERFFKLFLQDSRAPYSPKL